MRNQPLDGIRCSFDYDRRAKKNSNKETINDFKKIVYFNFRIFFVVFINNFFCFHLIEKMQSKYFLPLIFIGFLYKRKLVNQQEKYSTKAT